MLNREQEAEDVLNFVISHFAKEDTFHERAREMLAVLLSQQAGRMYAAEK